MKSVLVKRLLKPIEIIPKITVASKVNFYMTFVTKSLSNGSKV
jgi:hypothetical protein